MQILVASTRGTGHFRPLLPFVLAAHDAGHRVLVAGPEAVGVQAARHALPFHFVPLAAPERYEHVTELIRSAPFYEDSLRTAASELFVGSHARAALPAMRSLVERWQPDVVLRETCEFSSLLAAQEHGVPDVRVGISLATAGEDMFLTIAADALDELREEFGLYPDPDAARAQQSPVFTQSPAVLDTAGEPPARVHRYRTPVGAVGGSLPDWWDGSDDPLVPVSFGTVAPTEGAYPDLYRAVIDAVADLPLRLLVTVGEKADPAELGPLPANVHAERWVPQAQVMPHAAAMVHHGGAGTTLGALAAGVPSVLVPLFADQPLNAHTVNELGAGIGLMGGAEDLHTVRESLAMLLDEPCYSAAASRIAGEIRRLAPVANAVGDLEAFAFTAAPA